MDNSEQRQRRETRERRRARFHRLDSQGQLLCPSQARAHPCSFGSVSALPKSGSVILRGRWFQSTRRYAPDRRRFVWHALQRSSKGLGWWRRDRRFAERTTSTWLGVERNGGGAARPPPVPAKKIEGN